MNKHNSLSTHLPTTFKIATDQQRYEIGKWLTDNNMFDRISYEWISGHITFGDEDDANAFYLKFGLQRIETTVERMIKLEED